MDPGSDSEELQLLAESIRTAMTAASGAKLDAALTKLGWHDMLSEIPQLALPLVFRLLGETGAHAPVLNDVVLRAAGKAPGGVTPLPFAGDSWVQWKREDIPSSAIDGELPIHPVAEGDSLTQAGLAAGRWAGGSSAAAGRCSRWRANTLWIASNSAVTSVLSKRFGIGWPRHWLPSRAPRRPS